ncbi:hypothetical protein [Tychonema sp. BBK16]|uniref:hypothetical protein n=1 Tax=Tychonema sp. BBK16 TaxID=2699888 RepID=UPI001F3FB312|nr:hypothetical protein [Tychonema sp. BBK16]MCF6373493.1 hypothetical protein [Tychonema sp. BBK16]
MALTTSTTSPGLGKISSHADRCLDQICCYRTLSIFSDRALLLTFITDRIEELVNGRE